RDAHALRGSVRGSPGASLASRRSACRSVALTRNTRRLPPTRCRAGCACSCRQVPASCRARGLIGGHELGRANEAGKAHAWISGAAKIKMGATITVGPCLYEFKPESAIAGFGHVTPSDGVVWQVPARRFNGGSGRLIYRLSAVPSTFWWPLSTPSLPAPAPPGFPR